MTGRRSKAQMKRDAAPSEDALIERTIRALPEQHQVYMATLLLSGYTVECLYMSLHGRKQCWMVHGRGRYLTDDAWVGLKFVLTEAWAKHLGEFEE